MQILPVDAKTSNAVRSRSSQGELMRDDPIHLGSQKLRAGGGKIAMIM
jgi:hypothetical protein